MQLLLPLPCFRTGLPVANEFICDKMPPPSPTSLPTYGDLRFKETSQKPQLFESKGTKLSRLGLEAMARGGKGEDLGTGSFRWHLPDHCEDSCLFCGEVVLLDALSTNFCFETHVHH